MWDNKLQKFNITSRKIVVPYLLKMEWQGNPIFYERKYGWMFSEPTDTKISSDPLKFPDDDNFAPKWFNAKYTYFRIPYVIFNK
jgi:DNA polymerase gamma 1